MANVNKEQLRELDQSIRLLNVTTAEMNALAAPKTGDLVFNTTDSEAFYYNGSDWRSVVDGLAED